MNRDVGLLKDDLGQEIAGFGISVPASLLLSTQQKLARWHFPNIDTAPNFSFFLAFLLRQDTNTYKTINCHLCQLYIWDIKS